MAAHIRKARSATAAILTEEDPSKRLNSKGEAAGSSSQRIAELEKQLAKAEKERDDLARDVEALCMQSGSSIFDGSMVLSERIFSAEKELSRVKAQLAVVTEERNNLREDLWGHKDSRRLVESSYIKERDRADKLEKELQFYQTQSARAMADRDKASWEAEELKRTALAMEARVAQAESRSETALTMQQELAAQLAEAQERAKELAVKARESETIPGLWRHIAENTKQIQEMEVAHEALEKSLSIAKHEQHEAKEAAVAAHQKLSSAERELEETRAKGHADSKAAAAKIRALEAKVGELEEASVSLELRAEEAEGNLAAAQAEVETTSCELEERVAALKMEQAERLATMEASHKAEIEPLQRELESVKSSLKHVTSEFEQASAEKVQALMRVSQAEQTATQAFEETGNLLDQIADLKERASQATHEKVAALMQVASLREQLRSAGTRPSPSPSPHGKPSGWRLWGAAASETAESESLPNGDHLPNDLRQAVDQLRAAHERVAQLGSLAASAQDLLQHCKELQEALADQPTHLQRRELQTKVAELRSKVSEVEDQHRGLLSAPSSPDRKAANGTAEAAKPKPRPGDALAAGELVAALKLLLEGLQLQSS